MRPGREQIELLGFEVAYLHSEPDALVSLLEWHASPGAGGIPIDFHEQTEEAFYVLRGKIALWVDGEELIREAGSYTVVRPGQQHTFWNPADEPAAYLTPSRLADSRTTSESSRSDFRRRRQTTKRRRSVSD